MKLAILTTSWPSEGRAWAGHFIADLASELSKSGHLVQVITPLWLDDALLRPPGIEVVPSDVGVHAGHLPSQPLVWPLVLGAMSRAARPLNADLWLASWWPSALALPKGARALALVHGSDVDLAERLPSAFVSGLTSHLSGSVAVAEHLERRFRACSGLPSIATLPLGASSECAPLCELRWRAWSEDPRPKLLTVARNAPGKGVALARRAALHIPEVSWAVVTPEDGLGPAEVRSMIAHADLVVVPSQSGAAMPAEGTPHIITQSLVAGVPLVGGSAPGVRAALRAAGQCEVTEPGLAPLIKAVRRALCQDLKRLQERSAKAGRNLTWPALLPQWEAVLARTCVTRAAL